MKNESFTLKTGEEYIELLKLLKIMNIAQSGGHAKLIVEEGGVKVNGVQEFRKRNKLRLGDIIEVDSTKIKILQ